MKPHPRWLMLWVLTFSLGAAGCTDPVQRAKEAQRLFVAQEPIQLAAGSNPNAMNVADLNGDGSLDIAVACTGKAGVCVLLGNGKGKFTPAPGSPFAALTAVHLIATGDFDSDKKLDLVVSSHDANGVYLLLGDGKGGFTLTLSSPFIGFPAGKPHNHGLAVGDLNGDGHLDVTMGHQDQGAIAVLLGDGQGSLKPAPRSPYNLGRGFYPHALGDVTGDGKLDVVAPDIMGAAIVIGVADGNGTFRAGSSYKVKQRPFFILLEDLNGDKKLDIAATHDDIHDVDLLLGDGQGNFTPASGSPFSSGIQGWKIAAADGNLDGQKDLMIGGQGGFRVLTGDGSGRFAITPESLYSDAGSTWGLGVGDFNKDGRVDVVVSDSEKSTLTVFLHK